jgi:hypothetical protein
LCYLLRSFSFAHKLKLTIMTKAFFTLMLALSIIGCKKDDCPAPPPTPAPTYPVEGYWVGKYGSGTAAPTSGFSMVVEDGGRVTVADGASITTATKAPGTWTLTGNVFKATYTYSGGGNTFTIQATFNNAGKMESGTYGSGSNPTGAGTWFMDRKN